LKPIVDGLSLFNYCELGHSKARAGDTAMDYAELSIYYGSQGGQKTAQSADITKSIVHCRFSKPLAGINTALTSASISDWRHGPQN
jgi:hypothetical protein